MMELSASTRADELPLLAVCARCGSRVRHTWVRSAGQAAAPSLCRRCLREEYRTRNR